MFAGIGRSIVGLSNATIAVALREAWQLIDAMML